MHILTYEYVAVKVFLLSYRWADLKIRFRKVADIGVLRMGWTFITFGHLVSVVLFFLKAIRIPARIKIPPIILKGVNPSSKIR